MILDSGAKSTIDLIKYVSGVDYYQNGPTGQTGAIFIRGSNLIILSFTERNSY